MRKMHDMSNMTNNLTCTFRISQELKEGIARLADAEGERMVSEGEMIRRLIERALRALATEKPAAPRSSKRALGMDKLVKDTGR